PVGVRRGAGAAHRLRRVRGLRARHGHDARAARAAARAPPRGAGGAREDRRQRQARAQEAGAHRAPRAHLSRARAAAMTFDSVDARGLTKVYGRQRALAGVDLTLRAGETVALLGPNGAGKSTLVGILATLVSPTAGSVRYGGGEPGDDDLRAAI